MPPSIWACCAASCWRPASSSACFVASCADPGVELGLPGLELRLHRRPSVPSASACARAASSWACCASRSWRPASSWAWPAAICAAAASSWAWPATSCLRAASSCVWPALASVLPASSCAWPATSCLRAASSCAWPCVELGPAVVDLLLRGRELRLRGVELRLAVDELGGVGVDLGLAVDQLRLRVVELRLPGDEVGPRLGDLRPAVGDLGRLGFALGLGRERIHDLFTPSTWAAWATSAAMAASWASLNGVPSAVWKTTVPLPPAASGKVAARWSVTWAVGVPGMEISPAGALPPLTNAPAVIARIVEPGRHDDEASSGGEPADPVQQLCHVSYSGRCRARPFAGAPKHARAAPSGLDGRGLGGFEEAGLRPGARHRQVTASSGRVRPARSSSKQSCSRRARSGSAALPAGANWKVVTIAEIATEVTRWG